MDADDWDRLNAPLRGLLCVEEKTFHETSADDPTATWLVVRLEVADTATEEHTNTTVAMLETIALLYEKGTSSRVSHATKAEFWACVITSDMMKSRVPRENVASVTRSLAEKPVCILLEWGSHAVSTVSDILSVMERLWVRRPRAAHVPPMTMGLRLSSQDGSRTPLAPVVAILDEWWTECKPSTQSLVAMDFLGRLDLSGASLSRECVDALTRFLQHHEVGDLRLDRITLAGISDLEWPDTIAPSILPATSSHTRPIRLSLSYNALQAHHVKAIADAAKRSTRPLAGLSLADSLPQSHHPGPESCWWWLAQIMFRMETPSTTSHHRDPDTMGELDVSENTVSDSDVESYRSSRLAMLGDQVGEAGFDNLWCRFKPTARQYSHMDRDPNQSMVESMEYRVVELDKWGDVSIAPPVRRWVSIKDIAEFRSHDHTFQLCARFDSLVVNNMWAPGRWNTTRVGDVIAMVGANMHRISVRCNRDTYGVLRCIMDKCPRITHLSFIGPNAESIMQVLEREIDSHKPSLRHLRELSLGVPSHFGVTKLSRFLDAHPTVELVMLTAWKTATVTMASRAGSCSGATSWRVCTTDAH